MEKEQVLDELFSQYIRLRDSDEYGMITCITCGKRVRWKSSDAGHFIGRRHMSVRWDARNVHAQCVDCNRFKDGENSKYEDALIRKYGKAIVEGLKDAKNEVKQFADNELDFLIRYYTKQVKILLKSKSL